MKNVLLFLLLSGCGLKYIPGHEFVTPCGVHYKGPYQNGFPERLEDFTPESLTKLEELAIEHKLVTCQKLKGREVMVHLEGPWREFGDDNRTLRAGSTWCGGLEPRVEVAWQYVSVLVHEYHHVEQDCDPPLPIDPGLDRDHSDWKRSEAQFEIDKAQVEFYCWQKQQRGEEC